MYVSRKMCKLTIVRTPFANIIQYLTSYDDFSYIMKYEWRIVGILIIFYVFSLNNSLFVGESSTLNLTCNNFLSIYLRKNFIRWISSFRYVLYCHNIVLRQYTTLYENMRTLYWSYCFNQHDNFSSIMRITGKKQKKLFWVSCSLQFRRKWFRNEVLKSIWNFRTTLKKILYRG